MAVVVFEWIVGAIAVGWAAHARGRGWGNWTCLGILFSPVFAVLLLIAAGPMTTTERARIDAENAEIADQEKRIAARRAAQAEAERTAKR